MAFKGTDRIGTNDYAEEKAGAREGRERLRGLRRRAPPERRARRRRSWPSSRRPGRTAIAEADKYVVSNEFGEIVDREGGVGLNAVTSSDETVYFYSFPSNRLELWAYLESERFLTPCSASSTRSATWSRRSAGCAPRATPIGRLVEQFLATAFTAHPYGQPVVGWPSDLQTLLRDRRGGVLRALLRARRTSSLAIVGDVKAAEVLPLVEKLLRPDAGRAQARRRCARSSRRRRPSARSSMQGPVAALLPRGLPPARVTDPDDAVYDVLQDLLSSGRTSRLYRSLVRDKKIAANASGFSGFPGEKYPNLFAFFAIPTPGHTPEEVQAAIRAEIERLKTEDVTDERAGDGQDAHEGQPDPPPRQQLGPRLPARHLPGARRRLARAVPGRREDREGHAGRHAPRGAARPSSRPTARSA